MPAVINPLQPRRQSLWTCLILGILVLLVFWPVLQCKFITFDDPEFVTDNPHIQEGLSWAGVKWAFTSLFNYWQPLVWLSYMLDYQLFGLNPAGFHFTGLLIHLLNTLLLFLALKKLTKAHWPSAMVAALFAFHPLHVETVAWVADRKSLLCSTFWMLSLLCYGWYAEKPSLKNYALILTSFALGLMCKSMLVTLPCVLLLLDIWPLKRLSFSRLSSEKKADATPNARSSNKQVLLEKIPFFLLSAASSVLTIIAQRQMGSMTSLEQIPMLHRVTNALAAYVIYLRKTFWPIDLSIFYPHPGLRPLWQVLGATLILVAVTTYCLLRLKKQPFLAMGWFWFLGTLVPVIGLAQVGQNQALADRYSYLSLVGIFIMLVWSAADYLKSTAPAKAGKTSARGIKRPIAACAASAVLGGCIIATVIQLGYWRNSAAIFEHTERVSGPNYLAQSAIGDILSAEGHLPEAEKFLQSALALQPHHAYILAALGNCYLRMGKFDQAANRYDEVVQLRPNYMNAHFNLALALTRLGQLDRAMAEFKRVLALQPTVTRAHVELGLLCAAKGNHDEALVHFREAQRLDANNLPALQNLAWTLVVHPDAGKRNGAEAVRLALHLCDLSQHKDPVTLNTLAAAYAEIGNFDAAVQTEGEAIALLPVSGQESLAADFLKFQTLYQNHHSCRELGGN